MDLISSHIQLKSVQTNTEPEQDKSLMSIFGAGNKLM
jgi:hypothetical protein